MELANRWYLEVVEIQDNIMANPSGFGEASPLVFVIVPLVYHEDHFIIVDVDNYRTASKWIENNRSVTTDFDDTVASLPKTLKTTDQMSTDFKA